MSWTAWCFMKSAKYYATARQWIDWLTFFGTFLSSYIFWVLTIKNFYDPNHNHYMTFILARVCVKSASTQTQPMLRTASFAYIYFVKTRMRSHTNFLWVDKWVLRHMFVSYLECGDEIMSVCLFGNFLYLIKVKIKESYLPLPSATPFPQEEGGWGGGGQGYWSYLSMIRKKVLVSL